MEEGRKQAWCGGGRRWLVGGGRGRRRHDKGEVEEGSGAREIALIPASFRQPVRHAAASRTGHALPGFEKRCCLGELLQFFAFCKHRSRKKLP